MSSEDAKRIKQIRRYCLDIASFVDRFGRDERIFAQDRAYFNAVSMCILQIGETANGLTEEFRERTRHQIPWNVVRGMRNWLAHAYAETDVTILWQTVIADIPALERFCTHALEEA